MLISSRLGFSMSCLKNKKQWQPVLSGTIKTASGYTDKGLKSTSQKLISRISPRTVCTETRSPSLLTPSTKATVSSGPDHHDAIPGSLSRTRRPGTREFGRYKMSCSSHSFSTPLSKSTTTRLAAGIVPTIFPRNAGCCCAGIWGVEWLEKIVGRVGAVGGCCGGVAAFRIATRRPGCGEPGKNSKFSMRTGCTTVQLNPNKILTSSVFSLPHNAKTALQASSTHFSRWHWTQQSNSSPTAQARGKN